MFTNDTGGELLSPDQEIVQEHAADDADDHPHVKPPYPSHCNAADICRLRFVNMHFCQREFFRHTWMALPTGAYQVCAIDLGAGIGRGKNVVYPMTTRAIRDRR